MDLLTQITNITKAHAYDIVSQQAKEYQMALQEIRRVAHSLDKHPELNKIWKLANDALTIKPPKS